MKKLIVSLGFFSLIVILCCSLIGCGSSGGTESVATTSTTLVSDSTTTTSTTTSTSSTTTSSTTSTSLEYRQAMRDFVQEISSYAKGLSDGFIIIPQNGHQLMTDDGEETGGPAIDYLAAIDGVGREDLFYGFTSDNVATPTADNEPMVAFMDIAEENSVEALVTDYCSTESYMDDSYSQNASRGYISFAADQRNLNNVPSYPSDPYNVSSDEITSLAGARNFLYLLDSSEYASKADFLTAVQNTNFDLLITDLYYAGEEELSSSEVASLKVKANGGTRLVIAYMSIGEAEDYRYYWESEWATTPPSWLAAENPEWPGNYKVRYWDSTWKALIYGNSSSYLKKILDAGFDGVYLDIIDAFEYFEE
ncbi:MAG: endo alpha-1,4 polygalactosaminidase [bacterium]